ncbi:MAG: tRNA uridine-5-carboxymethylaminomethyl(34) synthesis GTPase MnmE [Leptospiraceae bacterium]|nr:tRNA uridine-5-carboxymethylaminomethyl(34) synthesis GTPase MnmE [Leptospiraceae bacterium]MDW7976243.1 tRNA uridine-5-carboxymethylaminomethyl(34) synthesis GTPase MnmE [Leptospiraceae bacterium]
MNYINDDTIIALSSSPGRGAISVVRISGKNTLTILENITSKSSQDYIPFKKEEIEKRPRHLMRAFFFIEGNIIDDGLFAFFPLPNSYTGEDVAEIYLHGNPLISRRLIQFVSKKGLARPALQGEFTRRAFLNGKMDLTKAESIQRLISAKSEYELQAARRVYFGDLYRIINRIRSEIILLKAQVEAEIDFSDQDIDYSEKQQLIEKTKAIIRQIDEVLKRSSHATKVSQGFQIALVGKTNAGKSSLMNKILGWERSIVSEVEGTTRDYVSEEIEIAGVNVRLVDTAGLRKTSDVIEREGIKRAKEIMEKSQLILHIIDGSIEMYEFLPEFLEFLESNKDKYSKKILYVINKKDILHPNAWSYEKIKEFSQTEPVVMYVSCKTGEGLNDLFNQLENAIKEEFQIQDPFLLEERQIYHFNRIRNSLDNVIHLWEEHTPDEIVAIEIQNAIDNIAELTGEITTEEVLGKIFSMFCIGK